MASFNVLFFDIISDTSKLAQVINSKIINFEYSVDDIRYRITHKEDIKIDEEQLILLEIEKYNKKPVMVEVYDDKNSNLDNAKYLSNTNYCIFNVKKKVCLLQNNKNGINISTLKNFINTNDIGFNIDFALKINKKDWKDIKDIKTVTVSQNGSKQQSLFLINTLSWSPLVDAEVGTVKITIKAKKGMSLPKDKIFQETKNLNDNYSSFKIHHGPDQAVYDLIKHKLNYQSVIPLEPNKEWFKKEIQNAYKFNILKI